MSPGPGGTNVGGASVTLEGDTAPFAAALRRAAAQFQAFGRDLQTKLDGFDKRFAKGFGDVGRRLEGIGRSLSLHVTLPLTAAGAGALAAGTKMDTLRRALLAVAGSTEEADRQFKELVEVAKLPGLGLAEAVQGSVRLQAVGVSADVAARALKAFGNAIATTGGGKSELDRLTVQLGQLSAKGKILAQDLRPIIEAAPAVGKALRDAFGTVDAQEIEALGLTTDQFLDRLLTQLEKLPKVTGGAKNSFENLQDALLRAGDAIAKTFLPLVTQLVDRLSALLIGLEKVDPATIRWAVALGAVAAVAGPLLLVVGQLTVAAAALATAFSVGLLPLIGVGGAVIIGLGLLAAGFIKARLDAAALGAEHDRLVSRLTTGLENLDAAQAKQHKAEIARQLVRAQAELRTLEAAARAEQQRTAGTGLGVPSEKWREINTQLAEQRKLVQGLEEAFDKASEAAGRLGAAAGGGGGGGGAPAGGAARGFGLGELIDALDQAKDRLASLQLEATFFTDTPEDAKKAADEIARVTRQIGNLEAALARARQALGPASVEASLARTAVAIVPVGRGLEAIHFRMSSIRKEALGLVEALSPLAEQLRGVAFAGADAFGDMGAALVEFVVRGGDEFASFADRLHDLFHSFVQGALRDLARLAARFAIFQALTALFPGSSFVTAFGAASGFTGRQFGGPVLRNHAYLVGEQGPELFVPPSSGRIVAGAGGGGTLRIDASGLPPIPQPMTPDAVAVHDWWRRAFSLLYLDHGDRGGH